MKDEKLNLIVVCGSLYRRDLSRNICSSGSDICLEEEIENMVPLSDRIEVISLYKEGLSTQQKINDVVTVHRVKEDKIKEKIEEIHKHTFNGKTDYLITQLLLCDLAIEKAKDLGIPIVYLMHSFGNDLPLGKNQPYEPDRFIVCTKHMKSIADKIYDLDTIVNYYSFNNSKKVIGDRNIRPTYDVLMFNPVVVKGGKILLSMVKNFPELQFLAVLGWLDLKNGNLYDEQLMRLMSKAHGGEKPHIPEEVELEGYSNLKVVNPEENPGNLIKRAKLLIVPSQWEEAFGRVIVEAGMNERIVIASNQSGIPEAMEIAGMPKEYMDKLLVDDYTNPKAWFEAIKWFFENIDKVPKPKPILPKSNIGAILTKS